MGNHIRVAVTGAAGQIGYALLFRLASGQVFGSDTSISLNLIELPVAMNALKGVVMELEDCAFPLVKEIVQTSDINDGFKDVNWAILVGSVPRKAGMERGDLLTINGGIFTGQGKAINDNAASDVRVLVVGNPCNTNALIAMNSAPDVPRDRFFAMTRLDQNRAMSQLARKAGRPVSEVTNLAIWGNHSSTQYPDFHNARIGGRPVTELITDGEWLKGEFISTVQKRGAAIIEARGLSSAASAANAAIDHVRDWALGSDDWVTMGIPAPADNGYGIPEGVVFGFPCECKGGSFTMIKGLEIDEYSKGKIANTLKELEDERAAVADMLK